MIPKIKEYQVLPRATNAFWFTICSPRTRTVQNMMRMVMVVRRMSSASLVNMRQIWAGKATRQNHISAAQPMLKILA